MKSAGVILTGLEGKSKAEKPLNNPRRKRWLIGLCVLFILGGLVVAIYWLLVGQYWESTDDAYIDGNIIQVMPQISGQVISILADETDAVKKGNLLVLLNKADAEIALEIAQAQLAVITRQVSQFYSNAQQLQANVQVEESKLQQTHDDYQRRQGLVVNKTISTEDLQHAKIAQESAKESLALAKQQLAAALALIGNVDLYHHPQIQEAAIHLRNAYINWARTSIYAPETGYVAKRGVQVGQQVNQNTVLMIIVPLNQIWAEANFKESQLKNIRIGQKVEITSDAYGNDVKYEGTILGISPGTGSVFDLLPPQNATGNWIKIVQRLPIRIAIDPKQLEKYPLRIGLSITAHVDTHYREGPTLTKNTPSKVIYETLDYNADLKKADELIEEILRANAKNVSYTPLQ